MLRKLLGLALLLFASAMASAEPPSTDRVALKANVPPQVRCLLTTKQKVAQGVILPLPSLGFVTLPIDAWMCTVDYLPPNAPAGVPRIRSVVHLFTLAD